MSKLSGVIPPVCTPLTASGDLDARSLRRLLDFLIESGVSGLFVLGSSSEMAFLTDSQRREVLETAVAHTAGRVPLITGIIDTTTPRVIERAKEVTDLGVDGIVATAPFYARTHPAEIDVHFRTIHEAVPVPLFAYDVPASVHTKLPRDLVLAWAADGVIQGIKDSSGDDAALRHLILEARDDERCAGFSILTGSEVHVDTALLAGADGVVPGLGNVDPAGFVSLYQHARAGRWEQAREEQERLIQLFKIIDVGSASGRMGLNSSAIGAFKAALHLRGVIDDPRTPAPQIPLSGEETKEILRILTAVGLGPEALGAA